ncbi:hypothetical protein GCM10020001_082360 [Nonomuraea salmonea]
MDAAAMTLTCVAGLGVSGTAVAEVLAARGERVVVVEATEGERQLAAAAELAGVGVETRFGEMALPDGVTRLVTTGWPPHHPLIAAALKAGGSRSWARSSWPGGCVPDRRRRGWR